MKFSFLTLSSARFRAVLDPLGGQTVTEGKAKSDIGRVVIVVAIGDSCHSVYALLIMKIAMPKLTQTIVTQVALAATDFAVDI